MSSGSMGTLRDVTLVFLVKGSIEVCLAMKKRGFGAGRWNGYGGKREPEESVFECLMRETKDEASVSFNVAKKCGEIDFHFPHQPKWDQKAHIFLCEEWQGEPQESDEMRPQWFKMNELPLTEMWSGDKLWLPQILTGKKVSGFITFKEGDEVQEHELQFS